MTQEQIKKIEELKSLLDSGVLTQEEYEAEKKSVLENNLKQESKVSSTTMKEKRKWITIAGIFVVIIGVAVTLPHVISYLNDKKQKELEIEKTEKVLNLSNMLLSKSEKLYAFVVERKQYYDNTDEKVILDDLLNDNSKWEKIRTYLSFGEKAVDYYLTGDTNAGQYKSSKNDLISAWVDYMVYYDSREFMNNNSFKEAFESYEDFWAAYGISTEDGNYDLLMALKYCSFYFYQSKIGKEWGSLNTSSLYIKNYTDKRREAEHYIPFLKSHLEELKK